MMSTADIPEADIPELAPTQPQLDDLVAYLEHERPTLLHQWKATVKADPALTTASQLTLNNFLDGIPAWLDALCVRLCALTKPDADRGQGEVRQQGREHGLHRWQQGYNLREVTREWGHIHNGLEDALEAYRHGHDDLDLDLLHQVRQALRDAVNASINESVMQYHAMQQEEAALHAHDLERALAEVSELERLRGEALREVSHDLRGGLTVVRGATKMLDEVREEPVRMQLLGLVERSVASLHKMMNDLMDLARLEAGQEARTIQPFDAALMLQELGHLSEPLAQSSDLHLHTTGPAHLPVQGDEVKVRRIAQNLLLNALKYTAQGEVTVSWYSDNDETWTLRVADTGPGLDPVPAATATQETAAATQETAAGGAAVAVERRAAARHGEGIGLSIVRRLCELLDACLQVETQPGIGSTFTVTLPRRYASS